MTERLLTAADPEPPRRSFVRDECGVLWWRTDSGGVDGRSANWCTVEDGCASGSDVHDHESWTKVAGNCGPVRLVEGSLDYIRGFLARPDVPPQLRELAEQAGAAETFALLAAAAGDDGAPRTAAMADDAPAPRARVYVDALGWRVQDLGAERPVDRVWPCWEEAVDFADLHVRLKRRRWHARGCAACRGRGVVPDWSDWDAEHGEPRPKPCPGCQPDAARDPVHRVPAAQAPQLAEGADDLYAPHPGTPDEPLFPEGETGAWLLRQIVETDPEPGPPWLHTVRPPGPLYDEDGFPYWPPKPAFPVTTGDGAEMGGDPDLCLHAKESLSAFPLRGWLLHLRRFGCPQCEREAHEAWVEGVRARFESALRAIANGWGYTWDNPGVYVNADLHVGHTVEERTDDTVTVRFGFSGLL